MVLCFFPLEQVSAKNQALMIGGGCETEWKADRSCDMTKAGPYCEAVTTTSGGGLPVPDLEGVPANKRGRYNLFAQNFDVAAKSLVAKNGWGNTKFLYSGANWKRRPTGTGNVPVLTKASMFKAIAEAKKNLGNTPGDQFLLAINTHGSQPPDHMVCMGDGELVPMREIKEKLLELKNKGIKVGVLDASCFSGGTVEIFRDSGICAISATGTNVTGTLDPAHGDALSNILGLAQPINISPEANKGYLHPVGNPNINGDQNISLSEALRFTRLHTHKNSFPTPRVSECSLGRNPSGLPVPGKESIGDVLESCSAYLNVSDAFELEGEQDMSTGHIENKLAKDQDICRVSTLASGFKTFLTSMQAAQRASIQLQHQSMGVTTASENDLITEIKNKSSELVNLSRKMKEYDGEMDTYCIENPWYNPRDGGDKQTCNIPQSVLDKVNAATAASSGLKEKIRQDLRVLIDYACEYERLNTHTDNHTTCESFQLFPANPATAGGTP